MVLSVTHGFIEYCGIHGYVHQSFDASAGGLLKAHSTEGKLLWLNTIKGFDWFRALFSWCAPNLGIEMADTSYRYPQIHTNTRHRQTDTKDKVCNQRRTGDIKDTTKKSQSHPQIKAHGTNTRRRWFSMRLTGLCSRRVLKRRASHLFWYVSGKRQAKLWILSLLYAAHQNIWSDNVNRSACVKKILYMLTLTKTIPECCQKQCLKK